MKNLPRNTALRKAAFTLVEVTLALGVCGFCLVAILGLLPLGLATNQAAIEQTAANGILTAVAADLRATGTNASSQEFQIAIPANPAAAQPPVTLYFTADGQCSGSLATLNQNDTTPSSRYMLTITFAPNTPYAGATANTASANTAATLVNLKVTWPAQALPANAAGSVQTFVALDRN